MWNPYVRPPWSSNYTMNINAEENYWLALKIPISELHAPFLSFIEPGKPVESMQNLFGANGWACHHNSDISTMTNPVGNLEKVTQSGPIGYGRYLGQYAFVGALSFLQRQTPPGKKSLSTHERCC
ncbi:MAG: hypothetical protein IPH28_23180 [Cytophagaceae bacterium]|nr:hypothetical protein [Cytophagaceae bacterium]